MSTPAKDPFPHVATGRVMISETSAEGLYQGVERAKPILQSVLDAFQAMQLGPFPEHNFSAVFTDPKSYVDSLVLFKAKKDGIPMMGIFPIPDSTILATVEVPSKTEFVTAVDLAKRNLTGTPIPVIMPVFYVEAGQLKVDADTLDRIVDQTCRIYAVTDCQKRAWQEAQAFAQALQRWDNFYTYQLRLNRESFTSDDHERLQREKDPVYLYQQVASKCN